MKLLKKKDALLVKNDFIDLYKSFDIRRYEMSEHEDVYIIEDSLVLYINVDENCECEPYPERAASLRESGVCLLVVEELTKNTVIPDYKHAPFMRIIGEKYNVYTSSIIYHKFHGTGAIYLANNMLSHSSQVMKLLPEVRLRERYDAWEGEPFIPVIFEISAADGSLFYAVDAIRSNVHSYVLKIARNLLEKNPGIYAMDQVGFSMHGIIEPGFIVAFRSHKNVRLVKRLQENMRYFSLSPVYLKHEMDVFDLVRSVYSDLGAGKFGGIERIEYRKPEYKWKSEELVFKLLKKMYREHGVIYQHRPHFLRSSHGHQLSYDVYISGLKVAVEYQGKQHFEPIDYFGGEESFEKQRQRDREKAEASVANGVKLVYVNYWEEISPELLRNKIEGI